MQLTTVEFSWIWVFPKMVRFPSKSSILIGFFHYKPSILGYPYFWKHPFAANEELWWDFWGASKVFLFIYCSEAANLIHTVDGSEVPNEHRLDVIRPCKQWDKLPTSNWWTPDFWIINSTINWSNWSQGDSHRFIGQQLVQVVSFLIHEVISFLIHEVHYPVIFQDDEIELCLQLNSET